MLSGCTNIKMGEKKVEEKKSEELDSGFFPGLLFASLWGKGRREKLQEENSQGGSFRVPLQIHCAKGTHVLYPGWTFRRCVRDGPRRGCSFFFLASTCHGHTKRSGLEAAVESSLGRGRSDTTRRYEMRKSDEVVPSRRPGGFVFGERGSFSVVAGRRTRRRSL